METPEQTAKRRERNGILFTLVVLIVVAVAAVTYNDHPSQTTASSAAAAQGTPASAPEEIKPESIYTTLPGNITCLTEDFLLEAIKHANAGEQTLFNQMLAVNGGPCMVFPAGVQVRVLSVDNESASHAIIRFNLADTPNAAGAWAIDRLIMK
jgi:hypothetical protein